MRRSGVYSSAECGQKIRYSETSVNERKWVPGTGHCSIGNSVPWWSVHALIKER